MNCLRSFGVAGLLLPLLVAVTAQGADDEWTPLAGQTKKAFSERTQEAPKLSPAETEYRKAISAAAEMTRNQRTSDLVRKHGLGIMNITWEDTGRYKGSSVGPNISDMSIQVGVKNEKGNFDLTLMPVIRYDNFTDRTADVDPSLFTLLVGNEKGKELKRISLREFLEDPTQYLHNSKSWLNPKKSLYAGNRDSRVLVSAQASFLPVPKKGKAEFNPVIFNYQSVSGDPAVLTILVTREGTSTTIVDNKRDSLDRGGWGQRLFHNQDGQRASLTGQRLSDFAATAGGKKSPLSKKKGKVDPKKSSGLNMVLLIQVPLKQKVREVGKSMSLELMTESVERSVLTSDAASDVEAAVIGHGQFEGPFTEIDNLSIERDDRFPVRVTVQFYKATATGNADEADIKQIKEEIDSVLSAGDAVGSLVVAGETGRITEYEGVKVQPAGWWSDFWKRHEQNTGESADKAIARLIKLLGKDYLKQPVCELYVAEKLRFGK
ncbi:MAG: hypothetical protein RLZZ488_1786 [Pseudomonadota bacterium]|jgi:hypothetical protein